MTSKKYNKIYYVNLSNFCLSKIFMFLFLRFSPPICYLISFDQDRLRDRQLSDRDIWDWKGRFINCSNSLNLLSMGRYRIKLKSHLLLYLNIRKDSNVKWKIYCSLQWIICSLVWLTYKKVCILDFEILLVNLLRILNYYTIILWVTSWNRLCFAINIPQSYYNQ